MAKSKIGNSVRLMHMMTATFLLLYAFLRAEAGSTPWFFRPEQPGSTVNKSWPVVLPFTAIRRCTNFVVRGGLLYAGRIEKF